MKQLNICYLLASTELCGGVRVVFDQARVLKQRGHSVTILSLGPHLHLWYHYDVDIIYLNAFSEYKQDNSFDIVIGTFWTTLSNVSEFDSKIHAHLVQGFEWALPEYRDKRELIMETYRLPLKKLTVGQWLTEELVREFNLNSDDVICVDQIVDTEIYRTPSVVSRFRRFLGPKEPYKVLLYGVYESSMKGIDVALPAIERLRKEGTEIYLIRVSYLPLSEKEQNITKIDEYHLNIPPKELASLYRSSDLLIAPSRRTEGFGLPFAEALASGLPSIASDIPSYLSFDKSKNYAVFFPECDTEALYCAVKKVLSNRFFYGLLGWRGAETIKKRFAADKVAQKLEILLNQNL